MKENKRFRVAIVGCGTISTMHAAAIDRLANVRLVACVDTDLARANVLAEQYGARAYQDFAVMLAAEKPDSVHLCTPHASHFPQALQVLNANIAVFTEKPPIVNPLQLTNLLAWGEHHPVGVCFQNRFNNNVQHVLNLLAEGQTGALRGARAFVTWQRDEEYYALAPWRATWELAGGGALINQAIHTLDLLLLFSGCPKSVRAVIENHHLPAGVEVEDTVEAVLTYDDYQALFYVSTAYCKNVPVLIDLCFENMDIRIEGSRLYLDYGDGIWQDTGFAESAQLANKAYWGNGHNCCIESFYRQLAAGQPPEVSIKTVEPTMKTMFAIYESAAKKQPVFLQAEAARTINCGMETDERHD